ncbi:hypothetical protein HZ326_25236 [Fusarium oxysporum f. sp. albedinis]|nr:hypothetical protein HZ326_25236 [Fusarium oxysporum f. sp. albedinis]
MVYCDRVTRNQALHFLIKAIGVPSQYALQDRRATSYRVIGRYLCQEYNVHDKRVSQTSECLTSLYT